MCKSLKTDQFHFYVVKTPKRNQQMQCNDVDVLAVFKLAIDARRFASESVDSKFFTIVCDSNFNEIWRFS